MTAPDRVPFYRRRNHHPFGTRAQAAAMALDVHSGAVPERLVVKPCTPEQLAAWKADQFVQALLGRAFLRRGTV